MDDELQGGPPSGFRSLPDRFRWSRTCIDAASPDSLRGGGDVCWGCIRNASLEAVGPAFYESCWRESAGCRLLLTAEARPPL